MNDQTIVIETDRIALCEPELSHVDPLAALWGDAETMKYIGNGSAWTREQIVERVGRARRNHAERGITFWTVVEKASGAVVGQGGLVPIEFDGPEIELGYRLGKEYWGKGYATEIAMISAAYGFGELGLTDLVAVCDPKNLASRRVLIKTGFREVGESDVYYGVPTVVHRLSGKEKG